MLKIDILIILTLIAYSIQDKNCLLTYEMCEDPNINNCKESYFDYDNNERIAKCIECENGYYLSTDGKTCIQVETKIDNCIYYSFRSELICEICNSGYAPSRDSKSCIKVETEKLIEHCTRYYLSNEDEFQCDKCQDDYFPSGDKKSCIQIKNCEDISNDYSESETNIICYYCKSGFALSYDGKSCIKFDNCYKLKKDNTTCDKCNDLYHPNSNGQCELTLCTEYNNNNECTKCVGGYYINEQKKCQKIEKENCLELSNDRKKCITCIGEGHIVPDNEGNCILPPKIIKGCEDYDNDGKCIDCDEEDYEITADGSCKFKECPNGGNKREYCAICKVGYITEKDGDGTCIGYDGSKDSSSGRNQVKYAFLLLLSLLF